MVDSKKHRIWLLCQASIKMLNELCGEIEKHQFQNEQFVLDWQDKINEISIKY